MQDDPNHGIDFQFYPTPPRIAKLAWDKFKNRGFKKVLEPSAGDGKLLGPRPSSIYTGNIDCAEIDISKHPLLKSHKYNVVGVDFLNFQHGAHYSHIIMNPPFKDGITHLLKAWDILFDGEIVCILNASNLRNTATKDRECVKQLVEAYGSVEFVTEAFSGQDAERKTNVEIAIVYLRKVSSFETDILTSLYGKLKKDDQDAESLSEGHKQLNEVAISNNAIENAVITFNAAVESMQQAKFMQAKANHYSNMLGFSLSEMSKNDENDKLSEAELIAKRNQVRTNTINQALDHVRSEIAEAYDKLKDQAWANILRSSQVTSRLTRAAQKKVESEFETIKKLSFDTTNIYAFLEGIIHKKGEIQIEMLCGLFDTIMYYGRDNGTAYMYWKSNEKHRVGAMKLKLSRFILPNFSRTYSGKALEWDSMQRIRDIDKAFAMLDGKYEPEISLEHIFTNNMDELNQAKAVECSYFKVRFYKGRGSLHFYPKHSRLMERFNTLVGKHREWLPPDASEMSDEYWEAYKATEKYEKEINAEIDKLGKNRWDDPRWRYQHGSDAEKARAAELIGNAVASVLESKGFNLAQVLEHKPQEQQLRLCA